MKLYDETPVWENETYMIRGVLEDDFRDLLEVYSDKNALPFFNSDNCDGDNFYYNTEKKMKDALNFWKYSYENKQFARLSIVEKQSGKTIGTIELCLRSSEDAYDGAAILRIDLGSKYERESVLSDILSLVVPQIYAQLECNTVITKAPVYAVERYKAVSGYGFTKSAANLIGKDGYPYNGYYAFQNLNA